MSWIHNATVNADAGAQLLNGLRLSLSRPLRQDMLDRTPQVVQVWLEPDTALTANPPTFPFPFTIRGQLKAAGSQELLWAVAPVVIAGLTIPMSRLLRPGRLLIRVHCGLLFDAEGRPFSASLQALTDFKAPLLPGGVFESWVFIGG